MKWTFSSSELPELINLLLRPGQPFWETRSTGLFIPQASLLPGVLCICAGKIHVFVFWDLRAQKPGEEGRDRVPQISLLSAAARNLPREKTHQTLLEMPRLFLGGCGGLVCGCTHRGFPISSEKEPSLSFPATELSLHKPAARASSECVA